MLGLVDGEGAGDARVVRVGVRDRTVGAEHEGEGEALGGGVAPVVGAAPGGALRLLTVGVDGEARQIGLLAMVVERDGELRPREVVGLRGIGAGHEFGVVGPAVIVRIPARVVAVRIEAVAHLPRGGHAVAVVVELAVEEACVRIDAVVVVRRTRLGVDLRAGQDLHPVLEAVGIRVARRGGVGRPGLRLGARGRAADPREGHEVGRVSGVDEANRGPRQARIAPHRVGEGNCRLDAVPAHERRPRLRDTHGVDAGRPFAVAVGIEPAEEAVPAGHHVVVDGSGADGRHTLGQNRERATADRILGRSHACILGVDDASRPIEEDEDSLLLVFKDEPEVGIFFVVPHLVGCRFQLDHNCHTCCANMLVDELIDGKFLFGSGNRNFRAQSKGG